MSLWRDPDDVSNPVPWQNWMAAYLGYTLRMKTLFCGWPVMVHDTHMRRRRSQQSLHSVYPLLPSQVVSIRDLQRLALYWFHAPRLQLENEVLQSTDQPHGTVCHQLYGHRDLLDSAFRLALKMHLFSTARCHWDVFVILAPDINIPTYIFTYLQFVCDKVDPS